MNIEETKQAIEVMQAYVDGAEIEILNNATNEWTTIENPSWINIDGYRIKPREFWVRRAELHSHIDDCNIECVKVREVL